MAYELLLGKFHSEQKQRTKLKDKYAKVAEDIYNTCFKQQRQVLDDDWDRIAVRTPRRCGKTTVATAAITRTHLKNNDAWTAIICLTQNAARRLYWKPFQDIDEEYGLGLKFNRKDLEIEWPNGGRTILVGADRWSEIDKLRGLKLRLVVFDEAKSYSPKILQELIDEVVGPALQDYNGKLIMIGTPGSILAGIFYESTYPEYRDKDGDKISRPYNERNSKYWKERDPIWSFHFWTQEDNPYLVDEETGEHQWLAALRRKKRNKWDDDNPVWKREYLGQWATEDDALVYPYSKLRQKVDEFGHSDIHWYPDVQSKMPFGLPDTYPLESWHFMLGCDPAFADNSGFVIGAYNDHETCLYLVWDKKIPELTVSGIDEELKSAKQLLPDGVRFGIEVMDSGSGGAKNILAELNGERGHSLIAADKQHKFEFIRLMGDYMHEGKVKILPRSETALEMEMLQWDLGAGSKKLLAEKGKLQEHRSCENHCCDAFLYLFKYWVKKSVPLKSKVEKGSKEWFEQKEREELEEVYKSKSKCRLSYSNCRPRKLDMALRLSKLEADVKKIGGLF